MTVAIVYTNHRGETATRRIIPHQIRFGASEWYVGEQWFLEAYDLDRLAMRSFAMQAIQAWQGDESPLVWLKARRDEFGAVP